MVSVLDPAGTLVAGATAPLDDAGVLAALRLMKLSRAFDAKGASLQRQGKFGTFSQVGGQEASVVGSAWALDPARDWIVPQYRELPALLRHGYPLAHFIRYFQGNPAGGAIPDGVNILPIQISIAAQLPHAVGLAWGLKRQGKDAVVLVYFGDGASSEGDFHEACNLAGVVGAPVVFFLQNNGWAISTPRRKQSAGRTLAERGPAYGFPGVQVDGNDLFAVYAATAQAVARARAGEGATLIESVTRRIGPHNTADDPTRYVDPGDAEYWRALDPIERIERYLVQRDEAHRTPIDALDADISAQIEGALTEAAGGDPVSADQLFAHVYADPPIRVTRQREARARGER
ncbi:MAG: pyruvate dehydrogenase (acetyl-transferring) E1 component subunit alpha [Candidatus Velthaea sp.]